MTIIVKKGQNIFDISVQETGTISNSVAIAAQNGLNVTDALTAGQELIIPEALPVNRKIKDYYNRKKIIPATNGTDN